MFEAIKTIIKDIDLARKPASSVPWEPDSPHAQPIFGFDDATQTWGEADTSQLNKQTQPGETNRLALFSWNIDFMLPHARPRMEAGLAELEARIAALPRSTAAVIFLQECVPGDLQTIGRAAWVRRGFLRTDMDAAHWASSAYGTTTLVDRRLGVGGVFRVHYALTRMDRDALFVDVVVAASSQSKGGNEKIIRFCNTHLESLAQEPSYRPPQVALAAKFMHEETIHGALSGDLNAIQPFDRTLHSSNGLCDAYLELGGKEDSEEGYTWGQQAAPELRNMYGCSRMDKVLYCGGVVVEKFARFGADVQVVDESEREKIISWGKFEKPWITDHLGIVAEVVVVD
ncbi:hypothetical protein E0Z10_g5578 [Xylaria hypoxylon]|uniref:Endonuclease/exonuclease/phosphatase domain-containing protein n=1 Tax=Xylaria hypoxylon TaxID=37992 RepID=A0A4Z0YXI6_9PEZI|nr:hypothetical protein E0Z10_g5578 [Xylaria hypoxylon]